MRLNPSIVRGILLTVEEKTDFNHHWIYEMDSFESEYLAELSHDEIVYHIRQCEEAGLINGVQYFDAGEWISIADLTPAGHDFLANTRNSSLWQKVIKAGSDASLPILIELAKKMALSFYLS